MMQNQKMEINIQSIDTNLPRALRKTEDMIRFLGKIVFLYKWKYIFLTSSRIWEAKF